MRDEWYFLTIGKTLNIDRFVPYVCVSFFILVCVMLGR